MTMRRPVADLPQQELRRARVILPQAEQDLFDALPTLTTVEINNRVAALLGSPAGMTLGVKDAGFVIGWLRSCGFLVHGVDAKGTESHVLRANAMRGLTEAQIDRRAAAVIVEDLWFNERLSAGIVGWLRSCAVMIPGIDSEDR